MLWALSWEDDNWRSMIYTLGIYYHALTVVTRRWQMTEHDSYLRDILPCSDCFQETTTTDGAWFIPKGYLTMLWLLSLDDNNWRSMVHTLGIYYHAPTVVTRRWHMMEHGSYLRDILPCSDLCHETITIDGACFILDAYITMLLPLSWDVDNWRSMIPTKGINYLLWPLLLDDDNWRSMFHSWCIYYHALTGVVRRWQMTKHDSYLRDILPCPDCCHVTMTTDGTCFIP